MTFRLLIDECLSPELVHLAVAAGRLRWEEICLLLDAVAAKIYRRADTTRHRFSTPRAPCTAAQ